MQIPQILYTRLPKSQSPAGKQGFQTVLYPTDLLDKQAVLAFESHIHRPEQLNATKLSLGWLKAREAPWLLLLFTLPLPEEQDEFGRRGVFLVHGFLLPQTYWARASDLLSARAVLEQHCCTSLQALFQLPGADWSTGQSAPLALDEASLGLDGGPLPALSAADLRLFAGLYPLAEQPEAAANVAVEGAPAEVTAALGRCHSWLPPQLRPSLSWDPAFDGGKLFFAPFPAVGYETLAPTTGAPRHFNLAAGSFSEAPAAAAATLSEGYYARWVAAAQTEAISPATLQQAYALAQFLAGEQPTPPALNERWPIFAQANEAQLRADFAQRAQALPDPWLSALANALSAAELMDWLMGDQQADRQRLWPLIAEGILRQGLDKLQVPTPLPEDFWQETIAWSRILYELWAHDQPDRGALAELPAQDRERFLRYLARTTWRHEVWFWQVLKAEPALLTSLAEADHNFQAQVQAWLAEELPPAYQPVSDWLARLIVTQQQLTAYCRETLTYAQLLEDALARDHITAEQAHALLTMDAAALGITAEQYPRLTTFVAPQPPLAAAVMAHAHLRAVLLHALITAYGYSAPTLEQLGFEQGEVTRALQTERGGWLNKLGRLLGRKR